MNADDRSERALVLAPRGRDAGVAAAMLAEAGIAAMPCADLPALLAAMSAGVGFVAVTEEALATADARGLSHWLSAQEEWSDLPFILLTTGGGGLERNPAAARYLDLLGNVTFLERPFHPTTLISLARSALRARRRQYDARARLIELHAGAERYRSLFESIDAGFCIIEIVVDDAGQPADYRFVEVNPAFVGQTGLVDPVGRCIRDLVPDNEPSWVDTYARVAASGKAVRFENQAAALGRWYDVHAFRVGDPAQQRVAILFNDISARRMIEEELRTLTASLEDRVQTATAQREAALAQLHEAQKLETLGQLTGGVAHDFNNLLTPITGVLDLLQHRYAGDDQRAARLIGGALESAERAKTLVQRLLGFSRRQALETRAVDLAALIDGMRDLIASSIGSTVELRIRCGTALPSAFVDPNQLELAILNLCVNARDAMPGGGVLTVTVEQATIGPRDLPQVQPGVYLRLSVIDTGVGMDEATLARAIEPFYSTKELGKGTGLGLSMVHGLASQLGGGFRLTSAPGEGTRVDLWLPVASQPASAAEPAIADDLPPSPAPLSILLVDDEDLIRAATADMLRDLGHTVIDAAGGADALARLAEQPEERPIELVVTDYRMPRMDGAELATRIRRKWPELPILLITGYTGTTEVSPDLPRLEKPFRRADLARALDQALHPHANVVTLTRR